VLGRGGDCALRIPLEQVSRRHCEIVQNNGTLRLRDLGSSNGTYVNGKRVLETKLKAGDRLRVGSLTFTVQVDGKPEHLEPRPPPQPPVPAAASTDTTRAMKVEEAAAPLEAPAKADDTTKTPPQPVVDEVNYAELIESPDIEGSDGFSAMLDEIVSAEDSDDDVASAGDKPEA
jgi:pSer/pThr/pTyr-binding forkhead associated (FHA) protein